MAVGRWTMADTDGRYAVDSTSEYDRLSVACIMDSQGLSLSVISHRAPLISQAILRINQDSGKHPIIDGESLGVRILRE